MKKLDKIKDVYLEKYDIHVRPYLTMDEIREIVIRALDENDFVEREVFINSCIVARCSDIPEEEMEQLTYGDLVQSGLLEDVLSVVKNANDIARFIEKNESVDNQVKIFLKELIKEIKKMDKKLPTGEELGKGLELLKEKWTRTE